MNHSLHVLVSPIEHRRIEIEARGPEHTELPDGREKFASCGYFCVVLHNKPVKREVPYSANKSNKFVSADGGWMTPHDLEAQKKWGAMGKLWVAWLTDSATRSGVWHFQHMEFGFAVGAVLALLALRCEFL
jgi:hypothetical protein